MIDLEPGDVVIAAVPIQDAILVFTQRGQIYKVTYCERWDGLRVAVEKQ